jgi:cytochrome c biogenesis protein CcdA/DsbC/DsbD-like thiol-disulfide interchange protein
MMRTVWLTIVCGGALAVISSLTPGRAVAQPPSPIELHFVSESDVAHAGSTHRIAIDARLDAGFHVNSNEPLEDLLIPTQLTLSPPDGIRLDGIAWPESFLFEVAGDQLAVFEEEFVVGATLTLDDDVAVGDYVVPGTLRYQACDDTICYFPTSAPVEFQLSVVDRAQPLELVHADLFDGMEFTAASDPDPVAPVDGTPSTEGGGDVDAMVQMDEFVVLGTAGGYLGSEDFLDFIDRAETGRGAEGWFEGRGPLAILALILVGGLALNLTPCVLPMIPINLAIIGAGTRAGSRTRGFSLGATYGLAMAAVYGVLGLVVILSAGTFGTINASPWFNLGIATLFVVLAAAMFDMLSIDFSSLQNRLAVGSGGGRGSFLVAFGMGGVAALLAGACVAPVVIQVIVFSSNLYATGTTLALALPFILGLGMALPWPIAGAGLTLLPKPGPWMIRVKQAFGVFILGTAVYYGYLSYGLFSQRWVNPEEVATSVQELLDEGWHASLGQGLQMAAAEGKPVLVDVWATWCKNCLTMDKTTLKDPSVEAALDGYVKIKFQAEDLSVPPASDVMERFEAFGLPTYAILRLATDPSTDRNQAGSTPSDN